MYPFIHFQYLISPTHYQKLMSSTQKTYLHSLRIFEIKMLSSVGISEYNFSIFLLNVFMVNFQTIWKVSSSISFYYFSPSCSSTLFTTWDNLLAETESDAQVHHNIAGVISRAVSRPLLEKTFHMKIQSRKIFTQRENYEQILSKTEEMLLKVGYLFTKE